MVGQKIEQVVISKEYFDALIEKIDRIDLLLKSNNVSKNDEKLSDEMTQNEVLELLRCKETKLWKLRNERGLPYRKVGKTLYFSRKEVMEWLKKQ